MLKCFGQMALIMLGPRRDRTVIVCLFVQIAATEGQVGLALYRWRLLVHVQFVVVWICGRWFRIEFVAIGSHLG